MKWARLGFGGQWRLVIWRRNTLSKEDNNYLILVGWLYGKVGPCVARIAYLKKNFYLEITSNLKKVAKIRNSKRIPMPFTQIIILLIFDLIYIFSFCTHTYTQTHILCLYVLKYILKYIDTIFFWTIWTRYHDPLVLLHCVFPKNRSPTIFEMDIWSGMTKRARGGCLLLSTRD